MIHHLRVIPLLIIIFLLSTPSSYAQKTKKVNYKGQILDIRTKEALPGAVVSLPQYSIFATTRRKDNYKYSLCGYATYYGRACCGGPARQSKKV